jgi:hypothetical protein
MEKHVMQVFELVTENGLTHLACRCRPQLEADKNSDRVRVKVFKVVVDPRPPVGNA